ncbi:acylphosphatase [Aridibaculum aurantiacum]|uniref:acylphosphatase n=1 Tax=Aridibaculum aurantiacum TaxID=2810307 RepID=UPI001A963A97|nr:acylphosphatase [Aridibaculum aurantiacum]
MKTLHLLIKGKVQGVFYRVSARDKAVELGLKGWVKNTADGNVEALVSGNEEKVDQFVSWCWEGPSRASVAAVETKETEDEAGEEFKIIR